MAPDVFPPIAQPPSPTGAAAAPYQYRAYPKMLYARDPATGEVISQLVTSAEEHKALGPEHWVNSPEKLGCDPSAPSREQMLEIRARQMREVATAAGDPDEAAAAPTTKKAKR